MKWLMRLNSLIKLEITKNKYRKKSGKFKPEITTLEQ